MCSCALEASKRWATMLATMLEGVEAAHVVRRHVRRCPAPSSVGARGGKAMERFEQGPRKRSIGRGGGC